jgi:23S rRNA pseudouridine2605 synthase
MQIRLNKLLSQRGVASRREADRLIQEGCVEVNGRLVQELGTKIDDVKDRITVKGHKVKPGCELVYMALHKPPGYLVTLHDPLGRPTIRTLIPTLPEGVFPVGRLDRESEGLLLLTNDGELAFRLTHPRYEVPKLYLVRVEGAPTRSRSSKRESSWKGRKPLRPRSRPSRRGRRSPSSRSKSTKAGSAKSG